MCVGSILYLAAIMMLQQGDPPGIVRSKPPIATPAPLKEMVERRLKGLRTARIESLWRFPREEHTPGDEPERVKFFSHKFARGDMLEVERGNADGLVYTSQAGMPYSYSPHYILRDRLGQQWMYIENDLGMGVTAADAEMIATVYDFRTWGLIPLATGATGYPTREGHFDPRIIVDGCYRGPFASEKKTELPGELIKLSLEFSLPGSAEYELDPRKDYSPTHILVRDGEGKEYWDAKFEVERIDGYWFPIHMRFLLRGEFFADVQILHASFNRDEHPQELDPATELHLLPGVNVGYRTRDGVESRFFNGHSVVTMQEFDDGLAQGTIDNSEFVRRALAYRTDPPGRYPLAATRILLEPDANLKRELSLWEPYTRDFIQLYVLQPEQALSAWNIWGECHAVAQKHVASRQHEIDALEKSVTTAASESGVEASSNDAAPGEAATGAKSAVHKARAKAKLDELWAPVEKIFSERLKPRLKALLTQEQVARGEARKRDLESRMQSSIASDE